MMKKFVANVMIWLLLTIPFVAAQDLSINQFSGQDNATGYARPRDSLKIEALAQIPGEDIIDAQQLRVYIKSRTRSFTVACLKSLSLRRIVRFLFLLNCEMMTVGVWQTVPRCWVLITSRQS
ncbi:hypothetical protein J4211_06110 [Candidatus Woesearchaeota archaeon]|nr:hypothetical protein [Candidatus Woesearchaeota archaeon]